MATGAVTVIIPTRDEILHIDRCIRSVRELGPVFVVDSGSDDGTQQAARDAGAEVVEQEWLGHARQKNWALDSLPIATRWVLFLDADEYVDASFRSAVEAAVASAEFEAWYAPRRNVFMGRPLEHAWWYPDYQLRLFVHGRARFEERDVHEYMVTTAPTGYLQTAIVHENRKGIAAFLERHQRYARAEALAIHAARPTPGQERPPGRAGRRRWVKERIWYRLKHRPAVRFLWLYVVRRGFLDGREGRVYCQLISAYEAMIDAYLLELEQSGGA